MNAAPSDPGGHRSGYGTLRSREVRGVGIIAPASGIDGGRSGAPSIDRILTVWSPSKSKGCRVFRTDLPEFPPMDERTVLWRYMDFSRLMSLLEDRALYFARSDLMGDPWEGALSHVDQAMEEEPYAGTGVTAGQVARRLRPMVYMNCWHASEHESAAMWGLYQRDGRGVALRTTWGNLTSSLRTTWPIRGGAVRYVNYRETVIPSTSLFSRYMHKRESFSHEKEARLLLWSVEGGDPREYEETQDEVEGMVMVPLGADPVGYAVAVDVDVLAPRIYVAPEAPGWYSELLSKVFARYEFDWPLQQSDLARDPVW